MPYRLVLTLWIIFRLIWKTPQLSFIPRKTWLRRLWPALATNTRLKSLFVISPITRLMCEVLSPLKTLLNNNKGIASFACPRKLNRVNPNVIRHAPPRFREFLPPTGNLFSSTPSLLPRTLCKENFTTPLCLWSRPSILSKEALSVRDLQDNFIDLPLRETKEQNDRKTGTNLPTNVLCPWNIILLVRVTTLL